MRQWTLALAIGLMLVSNPATHAQQQKGTTGSSSSAMAHATLVGADGRNVGQATFQQTAQGVLVRFAFSNAAPGVHAMHIHEVGRCDGPSFESAGAHLNPAKRKHGFANPDGAHAGDLPNIEVPASKALSAEHFVHAVTLDRGAQSLLDDNGSALVLHDGKDDHASDPSGQAGDRIACGPILIGAK